VYECATLYFVQIESNVCDRRTNDRDLWLSSTKKALRVKKAQKKLANDPPQAYNHLIITLFI